jgi:hypothetical protein
LLVDVRDDFPGPWAADALLDLSHAGLRRVERDSTVAIGSFTTIALTFGLQRDLNSRVNARVGFGGLAYAASKSGVFASGSGGIIPLIALGATYRPPFGSRRGLELGVQYDVHRFITPALRDDGFNHPHVVHRLALAVRARVLGR